MFVSRNFCNQSTQHTVMINACSCLLVVLDRSVSMPCSRQPDQASHSRLLCIDAKKRFFFKSKKKSCL